MDAAINPSTRSRTKTERRRSVMRRAGEGEAAFSPLKTPRRPIASRHWGRKRPDRRPGADPDRRPDERDPLSEVASRRATRETLHSRSNREGSAGGGVIVDVSAKRPRG